VFGIFVLILVTIDNNKSGTSFGGFSKARLQNKTHSAFVCLSERAYVNIRVHSRPVNKGRNKFCLCLLVGVRSQPRPVNKSFGATQGKKRIFEFFFMASKESNIF